MISLGLRRSRCYIIQNTILHSWRVIVTNTIGRILQPKSTLINTTARVNAKTSGFALFSTLFFVTLASQKNMQQGNLIKWSYVF